MELIDKVKKLEKAGLNWLEIAELLDSTYEEVRSLAESEENDLSLERPLLC